MPTPRDSLDQNPFWVLDATPIMTRGEIERQGQKLLGLLAVGAVSANRYMSPHGERGRTAEDVRAALADLRDPAQRLRWEVFTPTGDETTGALPENRAAPASAAPWSDALAVGGWRR